MEDKKVILEVKDLKKYFPLGKGKLDKNKKYVKAVDGVSFKLYEGETLGLVGESGCGKSTLGRAILRLHEPTSGEVHFNGEDILKKNRKEMRKLREEMQIIFQDPYSSLNPRMNVYNILRCLLYQSDAADDRLCVDLGGSRILKKKIPVRLRGCENTHTT